MSKHMEVKAVFKGRRKRGEKRVRGRGRRAGGGKIKKLRSWNRKSYQNFTLSLFKRLHQESPILSSSSPPPPFYLLSFSFSFSFRLLFTPRSSPYVPSIQLISRVFSAFSLFLSLILFPLISSTSWHKEEWSGRIYKQRRLNLRKSFVNALEVLILTTTPSMVVDLHLKVHKPLSS